MQTRDKRVRRRSRAFRVSATRPLTSFGRSRRLSSLAFQSISPGDDFEFAAHGFFDRDYGVHLEHECGEHRTELVNGHQIVAFHQHMPTPFADSDHKEVDLEIAR